MHTKFELQSSQEHKQHRLHWCVTYLHLELSDSSRSLPNTHLLITVKICDYLGGLS